MGSAGADLTNKTAVTLTLSAEDNGSGVERMEFSNDATVLIIESEPFATGEEGLVFIIWRWPQRQLCKI